LGEAAGDLASARGLLDEADTILKAVSAPHIRRIEAIRAGPINSFRKSGEKL
jgi:hypothetical protein